MSRILLLFLCFTVGTFAVPSSGSRYSHYRCTACVRDAHGRIKRSRAVTTDFKHRHPCPSTGRSGGRWPGYIIDHVRPLECGGADTTENMQWQTVSAAKIKDRTEGSCR